MHILRKLITLKF